MHAIVLLAIVPYRSRRDDVSTFPPDIDARRDHASAIIDLNPCWQPEVIMGAAPWRLNFAGDWHRAMLFAQFIQGAETIDTLLGIEVDIEHHKT